MKRKNLPICCLMVVGLFFAGCSVIREMPRQGVGQVAGTQTISSPTQMASTSTPKREGEFAIYLLAQDLSMYQLAESDLSTLEREDEPILTLDDIVSYRWETHEIVLIPYAGGRFSRLKVPLDGLPFVVCVGDEAIYSGAFWSMYSSAIYDGISIWVPLLEGPVLPIKLGYPDVNYFGGEDTRSDPRILESLERAGVLE